VTDEKIRLLERESRADPRNDAARERLQHAWVRAGRGWHGETLPRAVAVSKERGVYFYAPGPELRLELVFVPPCEAGAVAASPTLERLTGGFYVGRYPVTWVQYLAFCEDSDRDTGFELGTPTLPKWWRGRSLRRGEDRRAVGDHPVVNVSLNEARAFCSWASTDLPSAAEWTLAAFGRDSRIVCLLCGGRGFTSSKRAPENTCHGCHGTGGPHRLYPWGNEPPTADRCVSADHPLYGSKSSAPVVEAERPARPASASQFGAIDMLGNVCEFLRSGEVGSWSSFRISAKGIARRRGFQGQKRSIARGPHPADDVGFRVVLRHD
jgi:formylglycine-generating enzyme required for sulfatase activity